MQCHTICVYAVPFDITLCHLTQRYTVYMYTVPFKTTLNYTHLTRKFAMDIFCKSFNSLHLSVRLWWNMLVANLAINFQDLVAKVKSLVTLVPVLGAILCPELNMQIFMIITFIFHLWWKMILTCQISLLKQLSFPVETGFSVMPTIWHHFDTWVARVLWKIGLTGLQHHI